MTAASNTPDNKRRLEEAFIDLAAGEGGKLIDLMADDMIWTLIGTTAWSRAYRGKDAVRRELLRPLFAQFADRYTNRAVRFVAEDDLVVVECRGQVTTKSGKPYNNSYCWVCRFADGKMRELVEYCDTALIDQTLAPPA